MRNLQAIGAFDRLVEIGVVEDDEGRVAAKLQRNFLHGRGRLSHQQLADPRRAGKGDGAHQGVRGQLLADGVRVARDDIENAGRNAGLKRKFTKGQRRQRRVRRGLDHARAANRERRRHFPRDHGERKIPRRDRAHDAHGLPVDDDAPALLCVGMVSP